MARRRMHGVVVRRLTQHTLPSGFVQILYDGLLSSRSRRKTVEACRVGWVEPGVDC